MRGQSAVAEPLAWQLAGAASSSQLWSVNFLDHRERHNTYSSTHHPHTNEFLRPLPPNTQKTVTMFGAFRLTNPLNSGLLWKIPYRLSKFQKRRQRMRLRHTDSVVDVVDKALAKQGMTLPSLQVWKDSMPREEEMLPKDKYSIFDRKEKRYRKGIHSTFWALLLADWIQNEMLWLTLFCRTA